MVARVDPRVPEDRVYVDGEDVTDEGPTLLDRFPLPPPPEDGDDEG
jgi:hypothetical protein